MTWRPTNALATKLWRAARSDTHGTNPADVRSRRQPKGELREVHDPLDGPCREPEYIPRLTPPLRYQLLSTALSKTGWAVDTILDREPRRSALPRARMKNRHELVPDARLKRLAAERGPASAEAYVILELREARSGGEHVFAFQSNGRYTVQSTPN